MKTTIKVILLSLTVSVLLGTVFLVSVQFYSEGKNINLTAQAKETPVEELILTNESNFTDEELTQLVAAKRQQLITFFKEAKYYKISELDSNYSKEEDNTYMVFDNQFTESLHNLITDKLYEDLITDFEFLKTENNKTYYKTAKNTFEDLFYESAIATLNTNNTELNVIYADEEKIDSTVNIQICEENTYNLCRRDDQYPFSLRKVEDKWLINTIF